MENTRKNIAARVAAMFLVLVMITLCILGGTLAKYITKDSGSDSARVAKFGVVASVSGNLFGKVYKSNGSETHDKLAIAEYKADSDPAKDNEGFAVRTSQSSDKVVAPGTYNSNGMTISLKGKPEVATKLESSITAEDIVLKAGTYGVMVPIDVTTLDSSDIVDNYYNLSSGTYTEITEVADIPLSGKVYKLKDEAVADKDYYPLKWSVSFTEHTDKNVTNVTLEEAKTEIEAVFAGAENDPNYDYSENVGSATLTWAWSFANDYSDSDYTVSDRKDTILGDLIANPMGGGKVVILDTTTSKYKTVTIEDKKATVGSTEVANLGASASASLTVKQVYKHLKMPVKGNIITINSQQYRVLSITGNNAKLMTMFDVTDSGTAYGTNNTYVSSALDVAVTEWYEGLTDIKMKNAIFNSTIPQLGYSINTGPSVEVGSSVTKNVYALDIVDIREYLNCGTEKPDVTEVKTMFWGSEGAASGRFCWLRSAHTSRNDWAWYVTGNNGNVNSDSVELKKEARAAFTIDLSKVTWEIVTE